MPERDPYDPDVQLENAALFYLTRGSFPVAIALFAYLGDHRPYYSPLWYGLGKGLAQLAHERHSRSLLDVAVATLRRSLREDPANPLSEQLLDMLRDRSGLSSLSFESIPAYEGSPLLLLRTVPLLQTVGFSPEMLVDATLGLSAWRDRMGIVMYLRSQAIEDFVPVLLAAVERDPHPDVRMSALKFLGRWGGRADVRKCLEWLVHSGEWRLLQPYVSMALRSISAEWAQHLARRVGADASN